VGIERRRKEKEMKRKGEKSSLEKALSLYSLETQNKF